MSKVEQAIPCLIDPGKICSEPCSLRETIAKIFQQYYEKYGTKLTDCEPLRERLKKTLKERGLLSNCLNAGSALTGAQGTARTLFKRRA